MTVKNSIDEKLDERHLTRPDIYKALGMSRQGFINLASGLSVPKLGTAYRVAQVLNCSVQEIWPEEQFTDAEAK